jgi:C-terminal processing protease CtpA/Prc
VVLDLRHNNGGTTDVAYDFLRPLARYEPLDRGGRLVVLIGPRSYSATMDLAGRLERDLGAVFVGWPTGGRPNGYSTERPFTLPYSGIRGTISATWHQDGKGGDDHRPWIAPDVAIWPTASDLAAGRDPVLETALELIAASR